MNNTTLMQFLRDPTNKIVMLTPLLYPNNRGFTMWNLCNIAITQLYSNDERMKRLNKFNANNSAAIMFASLVFYITSPKQFKQWLIQENFTHLSEKLVHILPFIYYLQNGYYKKCDAKISMMSMFYEIIWSYKTGNNIINKEDIYYKASSIIVWYYVWICKLYGHFFNIKTPTEYLK